MGKVHRLEASVLAFIPNFAPLSLHSLRGELPIDLECSHPNRPLIAWPWKQLLASVGDLPSSGPRDTLQPFGLWAARPRVLKDLTHHLVGKSGFLSERVDPYPQECLPLPALLFLARWHNCGPQAGDSESCPSCWAFPVWHLGSPEDLRGQATLTLKASLYTHQVRKAGRHSNHYRPLCECLVG